LLSDIAPLPLRKADIVTRRGAPYQWR